MPAVKNTFSKYCNMIGCTDGIGNGNRCTKKELVGGFQVTSERAEITNNPIRYVGHLGFKIEVYS